MRHYITLPKVANQSIIVNFNPIWNGRGGGGGAKMPPFVFFFKYLQNEKRYYFALL